MQFNESTPVPGPDAEQLRALNHCYHQAGLMLLEPADMLKAEHLAVPALSTGRLKAWWQGTPTVTVVLACQNDANCLAQVLTSWQRQDWPQLQILLIDDASSDDCLAIAEQFAASDMRIHRIALPDSQGVSAAFNEGIRRASGRFVLLQQANVWAHPQLLSQLLQPLLHNPKLQAVGCYVADTAFVGMPQVMDAAKVSTVLVRRSLTRQFGFLDRVRFGYLTEYLRRIEAVLPSDAVSYLNHAPLGVRLTLSNEQVPTGSLRRYLAAASAWHAVATKPCQLHMAQFPEQYAFPVPALMCQGTIAQREGRQLALLKQSALFDAGWYLQTYSDVAAAGMDPALHYLRYGGQENRDPGPDFSSSGYRLLQSVSTEANPLLHYLETLEDTPKAQQPYGCVQQRGQCPLWPEQPWLMVVCHAAGPELFGAERSLLDVLDALQALQCNVLLTLPGSRSESYLAQLKGKVQQLAVLPYRWWHREQPECQQSIQHFVALMQQYRPQLCYCNTLVLSEPLHAARQLLIPGIVHVRELPEADAALCQQLGADAGQIRQHLLALADGFIANSQIVADYLAAPERTRVIANVVDTDRFAAILPRAEPSPLRIGMISSNLPKKGLQDFIQLSQLLAEQQPEVECWLIGPDNEHTMRLKTEQAAGRLPTSLHFAGYASSPEEALAPLDIVVNLSHFQESFGRTVLEAMAAGRVVVCYRWGALPELVRHEQTGLLADFADVESVAAAIVRLAADQSLRTRLAMTARQQVLQHYHATALQKQLQLWLAEQNSFAQEAL